jgi:hypothetical protein
LPGQNFHLLEQRNFHGTPGPLHLRAEIAAAELVKSLFARDLAPKEVIEMLKEDATISDSVRLRVLELAQRRHAEPISTQ